MLFLDGVYVTTGEGLSFRRVPSPTVVGLEKLVRAISEQVDRALERQGLLVRDLESSFLTLASPDGAGFDDLLGHSITYRIALGPHQGRLAAPAKRGRYGTETTDEPVPARHVSMTWAQRLKRVLKIDIETCDHCGGALKVIASIEDPAVINKILEHLDRRAQAAPPVFRPFARAPPQARLPGLTEPG